MNIKFEGETCIPGKTPKRIENEHFERYGFASQFVNGKYVLDIACGAGYGSNMLGKAGAVRVDAVDISEQLIDYAKKNYELKNINFQTGDVRSFKSDIQYDVIVCFETIEHVDDYNKTLANLRTLLKEDGMLLVSSPNRCIASPKAKSSSDKLENIHHVNEFTVEELKTILEENRFKVSPGEVFGQRHRIHFKNEYLRKIYKKLFNPDECSSPVVSRIRILTPKYFLIIARKT